MEIPAIMNQPPGNLDDQIGQLTYRPERMAIHWLDELGAAHVPSASQGRVLGFIGDDGAVELANIVEGLAGKARMRLRPGLGSSSEPHALARSAAEGQTRRWKSPSSTPNRSSGTGRWRRCPTCWSTSTAARPPASGASRNLGDRRQVDRLGPDLRRGSAGAQRLLSRCFP
jgi:hypothetical protein